MTLYTTPPPSASRPRHAAPAGAIDTHSHVFGPFDRFPPRQRSVYALPLADPESHAVMRERVGIARSVLTQPAPYGADPSAMLAAIAGSDGALQGVAVAPADISPDTLARWSAGGVVGLRFVDMTAPNGAPYPGSVDSGALFALAPAMRSLGMHAQLWAPAARHAELLPRLAALHIPIVLDHMGSVDIDAGADAAPFLDILDAMADGFLWVKHTLCRFFAAAPTFDTLRPFHDQMLARAPGRMVWGSDWPYVRLDPAPDAGAMLDILADWTPDDDLRKKILVDNPQELYGFAATQGAA